MSGASPQVAPVTDRILKAVKQYWGFDALRPLQVDAIHAGLNHRDSLVVMPTGGGKSLCYQVPPLLANRTDLVVSPLISLMKDQVDGLRQCGYPAAALHSGLSLDAIRRTEQDILQGKVHLVFVAPERLMTPNFLRMVERMNVRAFAIDEAHCISHWGHDFRPEYRQLVQLQAKFPKASLHAYTATATPRVRQDIVDQLRLRNPAVLIGAFDRPNLVYRIVPRLDVYGQVLDVVRRHSKEAIIVYCISRRDTEEMATYLRDNKVKAAHYHAGMEADDRRKTQDAFAEEKLDVVVATVAFGMGIDRSDVRCVVHAAMPKSIEHYQQETGRAGRDGLEAECVLFYSTADVFKWENLIDKSAENAENPRQVVSAMRQLLQQMQRLCNSATCRHKSLSEYFGQSYERENCAACDVCLEEMEAVPDSTVTAQKILSCVARVDQRFGASHVVDVLLGANTELIRNCRHHQLSTYGLMKGEDKKSLTNLIYQLIDQGLVERTSGDRPILRLNDASWRVLRKQQEVKLLRPRAGGVRRTMIDVVSWDGVDHGLLDSLRVLRRTLAEDRGVPPYMVLDDRSLREIAAVRPASPQSFINIRGVGQRKTLEFGDEITRHVIDYCREHGLATDVAVGSRPRNVLAPKSAGTRNAFKMFANGATIESVMASLGRAHSTTCRYLADYIRSERPVNIDRWVDPGIYLKVSAKAREFGCQRLKPIYDALDGKVPYDEIRLVVTHLQVRDAAAIGQPAAETRQASSGDVVRF